MTTDIASLATNLSQMQFSSSVSVAVAKKAMDMQKDQGAAAISLLESAASMQRDVARQGIRTASGGIDVTA